VGKLCWQNHIVLKKPDPTATWLQTPTERPQQQVAAPVPPQLLVHHLIFSRQNVNQNPLFNLALAIQTAHNLKVDHHKNLYTTEAMKNMSFQKTG